MTMVPENSQPTELINSNGDFNESGFEDFLRRVAASIPVIAIVGPQSSGKSTLMNHLFSTDFGVMDAEIGRRKTTKGIWIAKALEMDQSLTVVLDLEGTDGSEKGEDDTEFEKQSTLFAIAIAHTVIINMWYTDVGREHAANRPLLKTVFEAMLSLFSPEKTTLHFVIRDGNSKRGTSSKVLTRDLKKDIEKIWEDVPKAPGNKDTLLTDIFNVEVTVLSNYEFMRDEFDEEVAQLQKQLISHNLDLSTSKISLSSAKKIWDDIKKHEGFKIPRFRLMVATTKCDEIAMDKLKLFESNQDWLELEQNAKTQLVKEFGAQTNSILTTYLTEYDKETMNFETSTNGRYDQQVPEVRSSKRRDLTSKALQVVYPAYMNTLGHLRSETLRSFTTQLKACRQNFQTCYDSCVLQFDQQCSDYATIEQAKWEDDASIVREQLLREIKEHALNQLRDKLSTCLNTTVLEVVKDRSVVDIWGCIRSFMEIETETAKLAAVGIFGSENEQIVTDLENYARDKVVASFKNQSLNVDTLLRERFVLALVLGNTMSTKEKAHCKVIGDTMPTKEEAYRQCLDMLSTIAVIRLDDTYDDVQRVLRSELMDTNSNDGVSLSSVTWENVPLQMTLITPLRCKEIWTKFKQDMEDHLAIVDNVYQELMQPSGTGKRSLPKWAVSVCKWAVFGLCVLGGVAAFTALFIWNPILASSLALALAIVLGIVEVLRNGIYMYTETKEKFNKSDDILSKHPKLMESMHEYLNRAQGSLITANRLLNSTASVVA
ncbi:protein ROOT HAIR DEFECTIVE 3 2-like isoform X1 [Salvia divinorum]|uniref:Protein ROOT HAIR DEFECTIVE 3 2-like isoform X1 n=1 Tax=Salvia divinorum TaxID=28513 RepID=A0ABD1G2T5_SALDI